MKNTVVLVCSIFYVCVQAKPPQVLFSADEEECISQTGVPKEVVLQYRTDIPSPPVLTKDPRFDDYIDCYAKKLDHAGKLHYRKDVVVDIPGYKTKKILSGVYCTEDELSGKVPLIRQCAIPPTPKLNTKF